MDIYALMKQIDNWIKDILQDNYVGVYFHGSLRLGSFNPNKSDLDFIIVVKEKMDSKTKQLIWDKMLENEKLFPKKGFEFSVVLEDNCKNIKHPIAYELHGSRDWVERYREGTLAYQGRKQSRYFKDSFESLIITDVRDKCSYCFCYVDKETI